MAADVEDYTCPLCLCILIEPVTIPCKHVLCKSCFHKNVDQSSLTCPFCRFRIGSWTRRNTKSRSLVDEEKWEFIKKNFPAQVQSHLDGNDVIPFGTTEGPKVIAQPGELRKEYEEELEKIRHEREEEADRSEAESSTLIHQLQADDEAELEERRSRLDNISRMDEEMARALSDTMASGSLNTTNEMDRHSAPCLSRKGGKENKQSTSSGVRGPLDVYIVEYSPKYHGKVMRTNTTLDRRPLSTESSNSLDSEVNRHFRPIKTAPRTPPKRLPDGRAVEPVVVKSTPRKLSFTLSDSQPTTSYTLSSEPSTSRSPFHIFRRSKSDTESLTSGSVFAKRDAKDAIRRHLKRKEPSDEPQASSSSKRFFRGDFDAPTGKHQGHLDGPTVSDEYSVDLCNLEIDDELLKAQEDIERRLEQEKADQEMARKLQEQLDKESRKVNRSRGSEGEYELRKKKKESNKRKEKTKKSGRQQTLKEVLVSRKL